MAAGADRLYSRLSRHRRGGEPGAGRGAGAHAGRRRDRPGDLLGPVRPGRNPPLRQRLRHRQEPARLDRHRLYDRASADGATRILVGGTALEVADGKALDGPALKARKAEVATALKANLAAAGYPPSADPDAIDWVKLYGWMLVFVVAATALYGPQAAALVEMFPTRIRYTAMSLPYHIGTGWVGGFLPVTSFALVAITGNIYAGTLVPDLLHRAVGRLRLDLHEGNRGQAARRMLGDGGFRKSWMRPRGLHR